MHRWSEWQRSDATPTSVVSNTSAMAGVIPPGSGAIPNREEGLNAAGPGVYTMGSGYCRAYVHEMQITRNSVAELALTTVVAASLSLTLADHGPQIAAAPSVGQPTTVVSDASSQTGQAVAAFVPPAPKEMFRGDTSLTPILRPSRLDHGDQPGAALPELAQPRVRLVALTGSTQGSCATSYTLMGTADVARMAGSTSTWSEVQATDVNGNNYLCALMSSDGRSVTRFVDDWGGGTASVTETPNPSHTHGVGSSGGMCGGQSGGTSGKMCDADGAKGHHRNDNKNHKSH
jgi:hypothetical protein